MALVGPTASGKSSLAFEAARRTGAMILSVDSMQVYRGMDIGTAKPTPADRAVVEHGMIDVAEPEEDYTVARFQSDARRLIATARRPVMLVGGSGLHYRAVIDPFSFEPTDPELRAALEEADPDALRAELLESDPDAGGSVDLANPRRVVRALEILRLTGRGPSERAASPEQLAIRQFRPLYPVEVLGLDPQADLGERVARRLDDMREAGLLDEVAGLAGRMGRSAAQAVGYKELLPVVRDEIPAAAGFRAAASATLELARRQRTWFRKDPRITWLDPGEAPSTVVDRLVAAVERTR